MHNQLPSIKPQIQQQYRQLKSKVQDEIRQLQQKLSSNSEIHYHRSITGSSRYLQQPISTTEEEYRRVSNGSHLIRVNNVSNTVVDQRPSSNSNLCHSRSHSHCHHHCSHHHHNHNHHCQPHTCTSTNTSRCNNHLPNPLSTNTQQKHSRRSSCSLGNHYNNNHQQPSIQALNNNHRLFIVDNNLNNLNKKSQKVLQQSNFINPNVNVLNNNSNTNGINQKLLEQNILLQKAYIKSVQQQQSLSSDIRLLQDKISRLQYQSSQINIINTSTHHDTPSNRSSSKRSNSYQFRVLSVQQNSNQYQNYQDQYRKKNNNNCHHQQKGQHKQKYYQNQHQYQYQYNNNNDDGNIIGLDDSKNSMNTSNNRQSHKNHYHDNKFENLLLKQESRKYHQKNISNKNNSKHKSKTSIKHIKGNKSSHSNNNNSITSSRNKKSIINNNHSASQSQSQSKSKLRQKPNSKTKPIIITQQQSDVSQQYMIAKVKSQPKIKYNNQKISNKKIKHDENHFQHNDYFGYDKYCPVHIDPKMLKLNSKQKQVYKDSNYRNRKHQRDHLIQSYKQQQIARKKLIQKILNHNNSSSSKYVKGNNNK